jgi:N-methylhydantoinase A
MSLRLGVDVGGTFTDVLLVSEETGDLTIAKVLSTPQDQSLGVMAGVKQACETHGVGLDALSLILHGSTVVTNMILEEKGAVGGLLTTAGHEQILHLARAWTPGPLYAWMGMIKPDPLVPLWLTRGVPERMSASGEVVTGIDEDATRAAIEDLLDAGTESLTIAFRCGPGCRCRSPPTSSRSTASTSARSRRSSTPTPSRRSSGTSTASRACSATRASRGG